MLNNTTDMEEPILTGKTAIGIVVSNNDPLHLGRIKVRIEELHPKDLENEHLPWVESWNFRSNANQQGNINVPDIGSKVRILFPTDDLYSGIYISGIPNVQLELLEDYPNTYGLIDRSGTLICANTNTDTYTIYHVSGTKLSLDGQGHCLIQVTSNSVNENASSLTDNSLDIQVVGNANFTVQGIMDLSANDINLRASNITLTSNNYVQKANNYNLEAPTLTEKANSFTAEAPTLKLNSGSSLDLSTSGAPKLDGKSFGIHQDTNGDSVVERFYAFSLNGSPTSGSAPESVDVDTVQVNPPAARNRQAGNIEEKDK